MVDTAEEGSNSKGQKNVVQQRGSVVDYWTKAMVQNMREETILGRKMAKIEREHTQVILQMTYDHRRLTDRLNLVNWYYKKKSEDSHDEDSPSSNSSFKSEDSRNFKAELREYKEWKERHEEKMGKVPTKAVMEPELRERMKMEWNSLRRPPQPVLPPLVKPSFMYRQWKKKNKKKLKLSPKAMFERRKMIAMAEDADKKNRKKTTDKPVIPAIKTTDNKSVRVDASIPQKKRDKPEPPVLPLPPAQKDRLFKPVPLGVLKEAREEPPPRSQSLKPQLAGPVGSLDIPKSRESTFSGHKTATVMDTSNKSSTGVVRPLSSVEATESTTIVPLDLATNKNLSRSTTVI